MVRRRRPLTTWEIPCDPVGSQSPLGLDAIQPMVTPASTNARRLANTLDQLCALPGTGEAALVTQKHQTESDPSRAGDQEQEATLQVALLKAGCRPALRAYSTSSALGHSSKDRFAPHLLRRLPWDPCGDDYCRCQHNPVPGPRSASGSLHLPGTAARSRREASPYAQRPVP